MREVLLHLGGGSALLLLAGLPLVIWFRGLPSVLDGWLPLRGRWLHSGAQTVGLLIAVGAAFLLGGCVIVPVFVLLLLAALVGNLLAWWLASRPTAAVGGRRGSRVLAWIRQRPHRIETARCVATAMMFAVGTWLAVGPHIEFASPSESPLVARIISLSAVTDLFGSETSPWLQCRVDVWDRSTGEHVKAVEHHPDPGLMGESTVYLGGLRWTRDGSALGYRATSVDGGTGEHWLAVTRDPLRVRPVRRP
jgi:hypothetical protein